MMQKTVDLLRPPPFLVLVLPAYNEEAALPASMDAIAKLLATLKQEGTVEDRSCALYVDDGSQDGTWAMLAKRASMDPYCHAIKFAGNAGHQNALWAGMAEALAMNADCAITMDVDLQDDPKVIPLMLADYASGCDIVYGIRDSRATDSAFKRGSARLFYRFMASLHLNVIPDHADYRLVARPVLQALQEYEERGLFLRGLFPSLGFQTGRVYYHRLARQAGETKYPLRKMIALAWLGVTSMSAAPLRIAGVMSLFCMLMAIVLGIVFVVKWSMGSNMPGWTSLFIAVLFLGSVQLFCLAIMGEYIAKIFTEVRRRPRYIIEKRI